MFLCDPCHKTAFGESDHLSRSRGPCESCGKPSLCVDCHCPPRPAPSAPRPIGAPFLYEGTRKIRVHRRTIASGGYPPHHHIWKYLSTSPTAILDAQDAVSGNTLLWVILGEGGYRFYILREHAEEIVPNQKGEFIP